MQNTRLNNLVDGAIGQLERWFLNPWRRLSLLVISVLFGIFLGSAIPTTAGQAAAWDIIAAAILIVFTEVVNKLAYGVGRDRAAKSLFIDTLNALKIGLVYSMFIEAFKIGS